MTTLRFRQIPHTADVRLLVRGANEEALLRHLALGIGRLVLGKTPKGKAASFQRLVLPADDLPVRLVRTGNEVLFWLFAKRHATVDVTLSGSEAVLSLRPLSPRDHLGSEIKAITFHALRPQTTGQELTAIVTLDL